MIKRVLGICFTAAALTITGKMISDYAEKKPALKNVKDKLKKTGQDFSDDCKEVGLAIKQAFERVTLVAFENMRLHCGGEGRTFESCQSHS